MHTGKRASCAPGTAWARSVTTRSWTVHVGSSARPTPTLAALAGASRRGRGAWHPPHAGLREPVHVLHLRASHVGGRGVPAGEGGAAVPAVSARCTPRSLRGELHLTGLLLLGAAPDGREPHRGAGPRQAPDQARDRQARAPAGSAPRCAGARRTARPRAGDRDAAPLAVGDCARGALEAPQRYKVQFTASQEYVDLLERARDLLSHALPDRSIEEVHLRALRTLVAGLEKKKYAATDTPGSAE